MKIASIVTLVASIALLTCAQASAKRPAQLTDEDRTVVQVYEAPGYTSDQVHTAARMWIAQKFESAQAVIEYENKEEGVIIGNGLVSYPCTGGFACSIRAEAWRVAFTMKVESKDGRFRVTFTNVRLAVPAYNYTAAREVPIADPKDMVNIRAKLLDLGNEIVASMDQVQASDDW